MIDVALKEWAIVCDLILAGRCSLLLRKGGIHEEDGPGRFRLAHDRFALFPASEHENLDWIKPEFRIRDTPLPTHPETITLRGYAEADRIWEIPSRDAFDQLDDLHPWDKPQIDMRFNYKPDKPIYLVLLQSYRFTEPRTVAYSDDYLGCKSWVSLSPEDHLNGQLAEIVLDSEVIQKLESRVDQAFS